ncbi:MAG: hypothetical protein IH886_04420 [Nitrospinae bacterium]|nr:hypothetical protein [Nitrospinota bacterium]
MDALDGNVLTEMGTKNNSINFTKIEQEIIILSAIWGMIGEMVNYEIFEQLHSTEDTSLVFKSATHRQFFNILLVDFLSTPKKGLFDLPFATKDSAETDKSFLYCLEVVCKKPNFDKEKVDAIRKPLTEFKDWLETECHVENVWFPSINEETDIKVKRVSFIKICGNISKHNFTRLDQDASSIKEILLNNNVDIRDDNDVYLLLSDFYGWFHDNLFDYHSSAIAEFLNNIRWGIYEYLQPEFHRSFTREDGDAIEYHFIYPDQCTNPFAKIMYWNLMNNMRVEPYMPKFEVTGFLKMRY